MTTPLGSATLESSISEDQLLAKAFQRGEPGAYESIYGRYLPRVEGVCRRLLANPHDAQEATQEAFLRVYQGLPRFNGRYQLGAWIARIATNVCLDQLRARSRKPSVPFAFDELEGEFGDEQVVDGPESLAIRNAESRHVHRVLMQLPPLHRAAIVLRDFEGLSYTEVAGALEITEVQCKALIHRARQNFKRSWIPASVASLLPSFRWMPGFKKIDTSVSHSANRLARHPQFAEVAASGSNAANACTTFLQACGAAASERIVGVAAAGLLAVGSFAAGAQISGGQSDTDGSTVREPNIAVGSFVASASVDAVKPSKRHHRGNSGDAPYVVTDDSTEPSTDTSTPTPEPEPTEPPTSDGGIEGPTPEESPTPEPEPDPLIPVVGFDWGAGVTAHAAEVEESVDCEAKTVQQTITTTVIDAAGEELPAVLVLTVGDHVAIELRVTDDGRDYTYNGGASYVTATSDDSQLDMTFSGSFSWYGNHPDAGSLPEYGRFESNLTLDCTASRVVTERVVFYP